MKTTGPMILAEELDADWSLVTCTPSKTHLIANDEAKGQVKYQFADMNTGGSHAVRRNWVYLREAGACARDMFIRAAASVWSCPAEEVTTSASYLYHHNSGKTLSYGQVAKIAAKLPAPTTSPKLKKKDEYRIIGQPVTTVDIDRIVTGKPLYGIDMNMPGQLHALVARCPYYRGEIKSFNATQTREVIGVVDVFKIAAINDGEKRYCLLESQSSPHRFGQR